MSKGIRLGEESKKELPKAFFILKKDFIQYLADYDLTAKQIQKMLRAINIPVNMSYQNFAKLFKEHITTPRKKENERQTAPQNLPLSIDLMDQGSIDLAVQLGAQEGHYPDGRNCLMIPKGRDTIPFRKAGFLSPKGSSK